MNFYEQNKENVVAAADSVSEEKENNVTAVSEALLPKTNTVKTAEEELANNIYEAIGANSKKQ